MEPNQDNKALIAWHRHWAYCDPEFLSEIKALPKRELGGNPEAYQSIAKKYGLRPSDIDYVHGRKWAYDPSKYIGGNIVHFDPSGKRFIANLSLDVTREQILEIHTEIRKLRKEANLSTLRYREPYNTKLLYAIFKARFNGLTFGQIFKLYETGELPLYKQGGARQFHTTEDMKRYFREYYPSKT